MKMMQTPFGHVSAWMLAWLILSCIVALPACANDDSVTIKTADVSMLQPGGAASTPTLPDSIATVKESAPTVTVVIVSTPTPTQVSTAAHTPTPTETRGTETTSTLAETPTLAHTSATTPVQVPGTATPVPSSTPSLTPTAAHAPATKSILVHTIKPSQEDSTIPKVEWTPAPAPMHTISAGAYLLEHLFLGSDTIARVRLVEVEGHMVVTAKYNADFQESFTYYRPEIWYEFEVLEYLKGSGDNKIWAIVYLPAGSRDRSSADQSQPKQEAQAALAYYLNRRESRWDNQEAIVFLRDSRKSLESTHSKNHYYLGMFFDDIEVYSVSAHRKWLPLASSGGASGASGTGVGQRFLLEHPDGHVYGEIGYPKDYTASGASGASDTTTIGLSELREMATMSEGELAFRSALKGGHAAIPTLAAAATNESVTLSWKLDIPLKNLPDFILRTETGYHILRRSPNDDEFVKIANLTPDALSYTDIAGITPSTKYTYILRMLTTGNHTVDVQVEVTTAAALAPTNTPVPTAMPEPTPTPEPAATSTPEPAATPTATPTDGASGGL